MWARRKREAEQHKRRGTASAGFAGAPRQELMREAIHSLAGEGRADRIGLWLEQDFALPADPLAPACLRGMVWERHGDHTPPDWERLSLEAPLPQELLVNGKSVYQEVENSLSRSSNRPMIGPLVGLRHALWTPIPGKDHLRGVLLTATRGKQASLPRDSAEAVAAELALSLQLEEEQRLARERQADLQTTRQILAALSRQTSADSILSALVASCTELSTSGSGVGASFAVIGYCPGGASHSPSSPDMEFSWESGDPAFLQSVQRDPLASLWLAAIKAGNVVGADPPVSWRKDGLARLVAIPLVTAGETLGVLVSGIPQATASLATLERLELRASLAVAALEHRNLHVDQLRRAARRMTLLESSPEATLLLDARGTITTLNRSARTLLEKSRPDSPVESPHSDVPLASSINSDWYVGARLATLFRAREQQRIEEWSNLALSGRRDKSIEAPGTSEGELVNGLRVRLLAPVPADDHLAAVVLVPAVSLPATIEPGHSRSELENVLEWVEEGIVLFGPDCTIRAMNTRFAQIAGLSSQEAAACASLEDLIARLAPHAAEPEDFARRWREVARDEEGGGLEELQLARPVPRVLERSVHPVLGSVGGRLGRLEIYRDLTAQRVFQAKLLQTEKLAALGQLVTGIAHELSNPLTSILGYAQRLLVRKDLAGRTMEARQIYEEAERAGTILRQLLLTARESRPERRPVSLNQVVMRAMELQRFGSAAEKIRIELDLDPALPFILGDAGHLQQVLMNLIGNARQAIAQEGKPGTIRLRTARIGDRRILLQVIDDGPGIPRAILARIFDPFFTTKPAGVGTGLGLAIVLSVVREHGGQINVSSPPSGGADFSMELPAVSVSSLELERPVPDPAAQKLPVAHRQASQTNRPRVLPHSTHRTSHRRGRVLVVEDEPTVARLIADVLEDEGLHVDTLLDGSEALDRAARLPYDLVICDMKMPGLDGQRFYNSLVRTANPLRERFLFVTGDVIAHQTQEFLERHRLPHVAKPFRVEELTEKVFALLDGPFARGGRASAAKEGR